MLPDMIEGWVLWLFIVGVATGIVATLVLAVRLPRHEGDVSDTERPAEAGWISSIIERHGGIAPESLVEEVLDLHEAYLRGAYQGPASAARQPASAASQPASAASQAQFPDLGQGLPAAPGQPSSPTGVAGPLPPPAWPVGPHATAPIRQPEPRGRPQPPGPGAPGRA